MKLHTSNDRRVRARPSACVLAVGLLWFLAACSAAYAGEPPAAGDRFDLSVRDIELTELLNMMAANNRVSIVCSSDVAGKVSVNFYSVPLDEALDAILTVNGLTSTRRGGVIHIRKPDDEASEKIIRTFELKWADPVQILNVLNDAKPASGY